VLAKVNADQTAGVVVSLNCETDFVAKNDSYLKLANDLVDQALDYDSMDDFLGSAFDGMTVAEKLTEQTGVIGEKIEIGSFKTLKAPFVGSYIHAGNKIATLVGLSGAIDGGEEVAKNVAMQVAAMNPIALNEEQVDASVVEKEIEITKDQLRQEGKPEARFDNIVKGKIKRFYKDNTLVNQDFIKDSKVSVAAYVKSAGDAAVTGFERVALV
jgi:elongation factor Ts